MKRPYGLDDNMDFGAHKGSKVSVIIENNPAYIYWCINNVKWFLLTSQAEEELETQIEKYKIRKRAERKKYSHRQPRSRLPTASQEAMLECFGHTGPNGGWGSDF